MSGVAVKAYLYLLCESWLEDERATIPNDDRWLAQSAQLQLNEWIEVKSEVMQHWEDIGGGRSINWKLKSISDQQIRNSINGKKGGNPSFSKAKES